MLNQYSDLGAALDDYQLNIFPNYPKSWFKLVVVQNPPGETDPASYALFVSGTAVKSFFAHSHLALVDAGFCNSIYMEQDFHATSYFGYDNCSTVGAAVQNSTQLFNRLTGQVVNPTPAGTYGGPTPPPTLLTDDWRNTTGAYDRNGWIDTTDCTPAPCVGKYVPAPENEPVVLSPAIIWAGGDPTGQTLKFVFDARMSKALPGITLTPGTSSNCPALFLSESWSDDGVNTPSFPMLTANILVPIVTNGGSGSYIFDMSAASTLSANGVAGQNAMLDGNQSPPNTNGQTPNGDDWIETIGTYCGDQSGGGG